MKKFISTLKEENISLGYLFAFVHFVTEVMSFYFLITITNDAKFVWIIPFIYDALAFVPQALMGYICDKFHKLKIGYLGVILLVLAYILQFGNIIKSKIFNVFILALGNACMHVIGAEKTLKASNGKLAHSAIFVSGGSFGVITGKIFAQYNVPFYIIIVLMLTVIPYLRIADSYKVDDNKCENFNYSNSKLSPMLVITLATIVVIVRGYMGYGLPTSWNKTLFQTILLYVIMGIGKALGGILSDTIGIRKTALLSTLLAIPFLCFGDNLMIISLIGVMFFSMTMAITLGILVSELKNNPGLAFGFTTIGLFIGTAPIFFVKMTNQLLNIGFICSMSLLCCLILMLILSKEKGEVKNNEHNI